MLKDAAASCARGRPLVRAPRLITVCVWMCGACRGGAGRVQVRCWPRRLRTRTFKSGKQAAGRRVHGATPRRSQDTPAPSSPSHVTPVVCPPCAACARTGTRRMGGPGHAAWHTHRLERAWADEALGARAARRHRPRPPRVGLLRPHDPAVAGCLASGRPYLRRRRRRLAAARVLALPLASCCAGACPAPCLLALLAVPLAHGLKVALRLSSLAPPVRLPA